MSDTLTPRTAEALEIERLERELATTQARCQRAELKAAHADEMFSGAVALLVEHKVQIGSKDLIAAANAIREQREQLSAANERIRRLTEAGDALAVWVSPEYGTDPANAALRQWTQSKEAKP